jgi:hypothetical protein
MEKEALKRIFDFLEAKENKEKPFIWKLINNEPFTDDELHFYDDLDLIDLNIETLPEGLKVSGSLNVRFSNITSLPKGLEVGGDLYIYGTPLTKYSGEELREMIKPGFIKGKIYA